MRQAQDDDVGSHLRLHLKQVPLMSISSVERGTLAKMTSRTASMHLEWGHRIQSLRFQFGFGGGVGSQSPPGVRWTAKGTPVIRCEGRSCSDLRCAQCEAVLFGHHLLAGKFDLFSLHLYGASHMGRRWMKRQCLKTRWEVADQIASSLHGDAFAPEKLKKRYVWISRCCCSATSASCCKMD